MATGRSRWAGRWSVTVSAQVPPPSPSILPATPGLACPKAGSTRRPRPTDHPAQECHCFHLRHRSGQHGLIVQKVQLDFTKSNGDCWRAHRLDGLRPTNARLATLKPGPHERVQRWHAWRPVARSPNHREAPASNASTPGLCNAALRICIATCKHHPTCGQTSPASTPALCNAPCSGSAARSADRTSPARDPHRVRLSTCIAGHPRHAPNQAQHLHAASCPSESGEEASAM